VTAIDFPNTPFVGEEFVTGTQAWVWDGIKWNVKRQVPIGPTGPTGPTGPAGPSAGDFAYTATWEIAQVTGPVDGIYSVLIEHNLGFFPNVTVKISSGDILETGIDYNNINQITLTMAQPFSGIAYLS
jgi:hypothetical protein